MVDRLDVGQDRDLGSGRAAPPAEDDLLLGYLAAAESLLLQVRPMIAAAEPGPRLAQAVERLRAACPEPQVVEAPPPATPVAPPREAIEAERAPSGLLRAAHARAAGDDFAALLFATGEAAAGNALVLHGNSGNMSMTSVFSFLSSGERNGRLYVGIGDIVQCFTFRSGEVVCSTSSAPTPGLELYDVLLASGRIERRTLDDFLEWSGCAIDLAEDFATQFERVGLATPAQLVEALQHQAHERFYAVFTAPSADYGFFECEVGDPEMVMRAHLDELLPRPRPASR